MSITTLPRTFVVGLIAAMMATIPTKAARAQGATISGKVTNEFGQALQGANVYITEMSISVQSRADGSYSIAIPSARVNGQQVNLRTRAVGYQPQVRPVRVTAGDQTFNFALKQDVNRLAEVVVTGVTEGTEQKKLAFSVARVDESSMPVPGANPLSQLQGKVAGVSIVSTSGRPGSQPSVLLRGPQSINAQGRSNGPLYIVDGIEVEGGLPDLNPQDIESVEVVKGAAASSLYGSRAGSGVIQIRTKTGRNSTEGIRFSSRVEYGAGDIEREYEYAQAHALQMDETRTMFCRTGTNCTQAIDFYKEALRVNENGGDFALNPLNFERDGGIGLGPSRTRLHGLFQAERWPVAYDPVATSITTGQNINSTIDATGRRGGTGFFASANDFEQEGAFKFLPGFSRKSLRLNLDQNVGDRWTFGLRNFYSTSYSNSTNQEDGGTGFFRLTRVPAGVNLDWTDKYGRLFIRSNPLNQGGQNQNPLYLFQAQTSHRDRERYLGNFTSHYTPLSWLEFQSDLSYDRTTDRYWRQDPKGFRTTSASSANLGFLRRESGVASNYNGSLDARVSHDFSSDLVTRANVRYIYEQQDQDSIQVSGSSLATEGITTIAGIADQTTISLGSGVASIRSIGMMAGTDVEYKDRYIVGLLARRDGSSLFGANHRWANYGRASFAWRVAQEPWWFLPQLDEFKLRASQGTAGGRPRFTAQYETFTIGANGVLTKNTLGNKDLKPETVTETEIGVDAEAFNRYGLTVNYARSVSKDQILPVPPSLSSGYISQWKNAGTMENKTWEASLNVPIVQRQNMNYSIRANWDHNRAYITRLDVPEFFGGPNQQGAGSMFKYAAGERYGTFYGRRFVSSCAELEEPFRSQCGGPGSQFQKNDMGMIVWTGGKGLGEGVTGNYWMAELEPCVNPTTGATINAVGAKGCVAAGGKVNAPWGIRANWGMPLIIRDSTGTARQLRLGNALPDYRLSVAQTFNYKKFFVYGLLDGVFGRDVFNEGRHWSLGDFMTHETDQLGKSVESAKPMGYYFRSQDDARGLGGLYDVLGPNSFSTEDASYMKIREVNLSYQIGPVRGQGDWTVSLIGRNLKTFTKYHGFDPEVGFAGGESNSSQINALDAYTFPNLRTYTVALQTRF